MWEHSDVVGGSVNSLTSANGRIGLPWTKPLRLHFPVPKQWKMSFPALQNGHCEASRKGKPSLGSAQSNNCHNGEDRGIGEEHDHRKHG